MAADEGFRERVWHTLTDKLADAHHGDRSQLSQEEKWTAGQFADAVADGTNPFTIRDEAGTDAWGVLPLSNGVCERIWTHPENPRHRRDAERLADAGLLTKRQAQVYVFREAHGVSRKGTASALDISRSRVDNALADAREKVETARQTVDVLNKIE